MEASAGVSNVCGFICLRYEFETLLLNVSNEVFFFRYVKPYWLVFAVNLASVLYVYVFVHETILPDPSAKFLSLRHYKTVWHLLSTGGSGAEEGGRLHRCSLWLYLLCFCGVVTMHFGSKDLLVLYELSSPLCWGSTLIGYGSAALHLAYLSSLLGLRLLQRCLADSWVALIGLISNISGLVVFSVADTTALMFTGERLKLLSRELCLTFSRRGLISSVWRVKVQGLFLLVARLRSVFPPHGSDSGAPIKDVQSGGPIRAG